MKLSIIVVSFNTRDLLRECLARVRQVEAVPDTELWVVDNASEDGSADMVASEFPAARLIRNDANVGFARANNQALRQARGEYCLLLNSDALVDDARLLRGWVDFMDANPDVHASGPRLVWPDGRHQVGDAGYRPGLRSLIGHFWLLAELWPRWFPPLYLRGETRSDALEVDWVCGAALLVRRDVVERVGGLDERVFMFAEDIEWGCRIRSAGGRIAYLPELRVIHLQSASTRQSRRRGLSMLWLRNLRALYHLYHPRQPLLVYDLVVTIGLLARVVGHALRALARRDGISVERARAVSGYLRHTLRGFGRNAAAGWGA